jgi:hypothetical protein
MAYYNIMNKLNIKYYGLSVIHGYERFVKFEEKNKPYKISEPQKIKFSRSNNYVYIDRSKYIVIK